MITSLLSRLVILTCGTLYPAYRSYKAVKTKSVRDYVKWMMYWIVFALFLCAETVSDVLISWWMPFYYEIKIVFLLWLLSPYTKGSSILYRRFVHPMLTEKENEIDDVISRAKQEGYRFILRMGSQGLTMFTNLALQLVMKGPSFLDQLRSGFEDNRNANRREPAILPRQQHQLSVRQDREFDNSEGREEVVLPKREVENADEMPTEVRGRGEARGGGVGSSHGYDKNLAAEEVDDLPEFPKSSGFSDDLPDIPKSDASVFRVPRDPSPAKSSEIRKERSVSKGRRKSGGRAAKNNAPRYADDGDNLTPSGSDISDVDEFSIEAERKSKSRDANANNVKSRGRRAGGGGGGEETGGNRDRSTSKTKIPRAKETAKSSKTATATSRRDLPFDDNYDDDVMLISSDDEGAKEKSGGVNQRRVKKKTTTTTIAASSALDV